MQLMKVHDIFNMKSEQFFLCVDRSNISIYFCNTKMHKNKIRRTFHKKNIVCEMKPKWSWMNKELEQKTMFIIFHHVKTSLYTNHPSCFFLFNSKKKNRLKFIKDLKYIWRKHITTVLFQLSNVKKNIIKTVYDEQYRWFYYLCFVWYNFPLCSNMVSTGKHKHTALACSLSHRHQFFI